MLCRCTISSQSSIRASPTLYRFGTEVSALQPQFQPQLQFLQSPTSSRNATMDGADIVESPRKRLKTDSAPSTEDAALPSAEATPAKPSRVDDAQQLKEIEVGITEYVSSDNEGFAGILKKRYTDFLVNEIVPTGQVLHLQNIATPAPREEKKDTEAKTTAEGSTEPAQKTEGDEANPATETAPAEFEVSDEDRAALDSYFGSGTAEKIISLHQKAQKSTGRPSELGKISTTVMTDRDQRIQVHQTIRRVFNSQLESSTDGDGMMWISAAANRNKRNQGGRGGGGGNTRDSNRPNWQELGGPYLHFTIYKENKDTMEVLSFISRTLRLNPKAFQFAGTKDRRGVTVQRACVHRVQADRLAKMNSSLRNARVGDFEYRQEGLELGDLKGNEFVVTLRESDIPGVDLKDGEPAIAKAKELVGSALRNLRERGYFNYYGLQRFGTFSMRTDAIGVKMLQGDFRSACERILHYPEHILTASQEDAAGQGSGSMISSDDKARAEAIHHFQTTGKSNEALDKLPRKFSAEMNLIRHLGRSKNDFVGALQMIPRNLRLMYVHAYQSRVWNFAAGERWRLYGDRVVEGDLVLVHEHRDKETNGTNTPATENTIDADGEVIIAPQANDSAYSKDDIFTRARALTAAEAASGQYTIFDVVLPLPGFDVLYPANKMTDFYRSFMGDSEQGGGLDPFDMRRKWKDVSLSGSYRKFLSRMLGDDYSAEVKLYAKDEEQFVRTDLEAITGAEGQSEPKAQGEGDGENQGQPDKLAVILKFQLGSSQYATMALRELMKGKVKSYAPDFGGGR